MNVACLWEGGGVIDVVVIRRSFMWEDGKAVNIEGNWENCEPCKKVEGWKGRQNRGM